MTKCHQNWNRCSVQVIRRTLVSLDKGNVSLLFYIVRLNMLPINSLFRIIIVVFGSGRVSTIHNSSTLPHCDNPVYVLSGFMGCRCVLFNDLNILSDGAKDCSLSKQQVQSELQQGWFRSAHFEQFVSVIQFRIHLSDCTLVSLVMNESLPSSLRLERFTLDFYLQQGPLREDVKVFGESRYLWSMYPLNLIICSAKVEEIFSSLSRIFKHSS